MMRASLAMDREEEPYTPRRKLRARPRLLFELWHCFAQQPTLAAAHPPSSTPQIVSLQAWEHPAASPTSLQVKST
jgi:hypothetical protein